MVAHQMRHRCSLHQQFQLVSWIVGLRYRMFGHHQRLLSLPRTGQHRGKVNSCRGPLRGQVMCLYSKLKFTLVIVGGASHARPQQKYPRVIWLGLHQSVQPLGSKLEFFTRNLSLDKLKLCNVFCVVRKRSHRAGELC